MERDVVSSSVSVMDCKQIASWTTGTHLIFISATNRWTRAVYDLEVPQGEDEEPARKRIKTQGVLRVDRGVPDIVRQEIPSGKAAQEAARGTTMLACLKNDTLTTDLLIGSCYDQRPFYMLTNAAEEVKWVEKERMVWSHEMKEQVPFKFLRWSLSDTYNFEMNDNDIADQYRLVYRCLRFQRNTKWWWAEFLYLWETSIVNAYHLM